MTNPSNLSAQQPQTHIVNRSFLHFVWQNSSFYHELYKAQGIQEKDLDHIAINDLPIIGKKQVLDNFDQLMTDPRISIAEVNSWLDQDSDPRNRFLGEYYVIHSSRSSSQQATILYDKYAWNAFSGSAVTHLFKGEMNYQNRIRNGFLIAFIGHNAGATTAVNSSRASFDNLLLSLADPIEETIKRLNRFQPNRLTSYSSCIGWLADLALAGKLKISPSEIVVSSDRLLPSTIEKIRQAWNSDIYDLYASVESLFLAVKQPGQVAWKVLNELQTVEILGSVPQLT